jgi:hypothetical protein
MLDLVAQHSPTTVLFNRDLRSPIPEPVDGLWSMFALLHLPPGDVPGCFENWRSALNGKGALALGLAESAITEVREVQNWLGLESQTCTFFCHRASTIRDALLKAGFQVKNTYFETPSRYRGGVYDEFKLSPYVVFATTEPT